MCSSSPEIAAPMSATACPTNASSLASSIAGMPVVVVRVAALRPQVPDGPAWEQRARRRGCSASVPGTDATTESPGPWRARMPGGPLWPRVGTRDKRSLTEHPRRGRRPPPPLISAVWAATPSARDRRRPPSTTRPEQARRLRPGGLTFTDHQAPDDLGTEERIRSQPAHSLGGGYDQRITVLTAPLPAPRLGRQR